MNRKVDRFLEKAKTWQAEMQLLREIILECQLAEDYKWMHPCYSYQESNIVLIHQFKSYCALLFFKGVLLKDEKGLLIQQTENVQDRRQIRFSNLGEIVQQKDTIKAYILEAVDIEKSGRKVTLKKRLNLMYLRNSKTYLTTCRNLKRHLLHFHRGVNADICYILPPQSK